MRLISLLAVAAFALAQPAPPPAKVSFTCTAEDIERFGLSCTREQPCPVYLELAAADSLPGRLIATGNFHTESATLYSALLASDDGGISWTEPHPRIASATLEQIQFIDLNHGWISGQTVQNLPRDPFLLITTDGGRNWKHQPVSEESRPGAVEQFWFESVTAGSLMIDLGHPNETGGRHELYRTMTGGSSWALEQVSAEPIRLKPGPPADQNFRVRADARTKTLRIERNAGGGRWETAASFPIEVGSCTGQ